MFTSLFTFLVMSFEGKKYKFNEVLLIFLFCPVCFGVIFKKALSNLGLCYLLRIS